MKTIAGQSVQSMPTGHIPALDGIRGLALLMVMLFHARLGIARSVVDEGVYRLVGVGWSGVDLFFVLSGFLITGILLDARGAEGYFRSFYARRVLRIFPLYYAYLFIAFVIAPTQFGINDASRANVGFFLLYLTNMLHVVEPTALSFQTAVTWSLSIEEQFYVAWPLVVLLAGRRKLIFICLGIIAISPFIRWGMLSSGVSAGIVYSITASKLDALAVGALIASTTREFGFACHLRPAKWLAGAASVTLLIVFMLKSAVFSQYDRLIQTLGFSLLAVLFGCILILAIAARPGALTHRLWCAAPLQVLGKYSYSMYLFHVPVQLWVADHFWSRTQMDWIPGPTVLPGQFVFWILVFTITLAIAVLSWNLFEKHFLRLKRFFVYQRRMESADSLRLRTESSSALTPETNASLEVKGTR